MQKIAVVLIAISLAVIAYFALSTDEETAVTPPQRDDVTLRTTASRVPVHLLGGCGVRQRNSPTGGSANGTPIQARAPK